MLHILELVQRRFQNISPAVLAFVAISFIALLASGIGWLLFRS